MTDLRTCSACGQDKPVEAFWRKSDGVQRTCKVCATVKRWARNEETRVLIERLRSKRLLLKLVPPSGPVAMTGPFVDKLVDVFNQIDKIKGRR